MADHRLPEFGDHDAGEMFCHHCAEPWPCEVDRLRSAEADTAMENDRLRAENAVMARLITDHLGAYAKGDEIVFTDSTGHYDGQTLDPEGAALLARLEAERG